MRRFHFASALTCIAGLSVSAGCAQVVNFDEYTYDIDPCGPQPVSCDSGSEMAYVMTSFDIPRAVGGRRDGFDLDATSDPICGQQDLTSPRGEGGVDNQVSATVELYEGLERVNVGVQAREGFLRGEGLVVLGLRGVDSLENDNCVDLSSRSARVPTSLPLSSLDVDDDGTLDPNLSFEVEAAAYRDPTACIIAGVVHARFGTVLTRTPGIVGEVTAERMRMRMSITPSSVQGTIGGALLLDGLLGGIAPEIVEFLRGRADIGPSSPSARDCESISFAVVFEGTPAMVPR